MFRGPSLSGTGLYWLIVLLLTPIACALAALRAGDLLSAVLMILCLMFPAVQLLASVLAASLVFMWPPYDRMERWRVIGWITIWTVLGTALGFVVMGVMYVLFCH